MVMRKLFTGLVLIPLGLIFVVFAVANRHLVTVSFDPFNSADPSVSVRLPLFVLIIAVAILGVVAGAPARGRCAAGALPTGRSARRSPGLALRPAAPSRPAAGGLLWTQWARQAGRDVVERGPNRTLFFGFYRRPDLCPEPCP